MCEVCGTWEDLDSTHRLLTKHHANCPNSPPFRQGVIELLKQLTHGMELWAADEDGIHSAAWEGYCRAKAVLGEIVDCPEC